jgi:hypothetical protein
MVPVCCNEVNGAAPVPPSKRNQNHIRFAFATPAAMVPTPTSDTNLTLMRASIGILNQISIVINPQ